jgi:hypothetical protein
MSREDQVYMAKLAEQAERYDEMVNFMKVSFCLTNDPGSCPSKPIHSPLTFLAWRRIDC